MQSVGALDTEGLLEKEGATDGAGVCCSSAPQKPSPVVGSIEPHLGLQSESDRHCCWHVPRGGGVVGACEDSTTLSSSSLRLALSCLLSDATEKRLGGGGLTDGAVVSLSGLLGVVGA